MEQNYLGCGAQWEELLELGCQRYLGVLNMQIIVLDILPENF